MSMFSDALKAETNMTTTTNGMQCVKSTDSSLVDLFGVLGAMRNRSDNDIEIAFSKAFVEDKLLATKMAFYARDIRNGGLGERRTARTIWRFLAKNYPDIMIKNIDCIPVFGRWDDLYCLIGTNVMPYAYELIRKQFAEDNTNMKVNKPISVMAKWLPSINASSSVTVANGKRTAAKLGLSQAEYRKMLSKMRAYIDVTERKMSAKSWGDIKYANVCSNAMNRYRQAFYKHDEKRFKEYIDSVSKGEAKINASTLFPYDIVEKYTNKIFSGWDARNCDIDPVLEAQWNALPDYLAESNSGNVMVMADTSGSMHGRPIATAIGLAIYFAERCKGDFKNQFMTFSACPDFVQLKGNSLCEKVRNAVTANWGGNTDIEAAFNLILNTAIKHNVPVNEMPRALVIISDMQFDYCAMYNRAGWTFYDEMKARFAEHGYEIPNIVFWNVNNTKDGYHAFSDYKGVQLMSGQSASTFKAMLANFGKTPYEAMCDILNSETYSMITV